MPFIRTVSETEARGALAELYQRLAYPDGSVDASFRVLSLNPTLLAADAALYETIMYGESPLSRAERELLALTVSGLNNCGRCVEHHSARYQALRAGAASSDAPASERERALLRFAEQLTRAPSAVTASDIDALRHAGVDDRAILDLCAVVAYFNFANRMTLGLGVGPAETTAGIRAR